MSDEIKQGPPPAQSRTHFLGDFAFPAMGRDARHQAPYEIKQSASWDDWQILAAGQLVSRILDAKPEELPAIAGTAGVVYQMLQQACTRGAKYQVAAEALLARVDELERQVEQMAKELG